MYSLVLGYELSWELPTLGTAQNSGCRRTSSLTGFLIRHCLTKEAIDVPFTMFLNLYKESLIQNSCCACGNVCLLVSMETTPGCSVITGLNYTPGLPGSLQSCPHSNTSLCSKRTEVLNCVSCLGVSLKRVEKTVLVSFSLRLIYPYEELLSG